MCERVHTEVFKMMYNSVYAVGLIARSVYIAACGGSLSLGQPTVSEGRRRAIIAQMYGERAS